MNLWTFLSETIREFSMVLKKSPAGSIYPYYYKEGSLLGLHYGSFFKNEEGLLARMQAEEEFIAKEILQTPLTVDFYETNLTDRILIEFSRSILRLQAHISRLSIVGCSSRDKLRFQKLWLKSGYKFPIPVKFFSDAEAAKTWLVSERS
jgi:hypothetical protein